MAQETSMASTDMQLRKLIEKKKRRSALLLDSAFNLHQCCSTTVDFIHFKSWREDNKNLNLYI